MSGGAVVILLVALAVPIRCVLATEYVVGGAECSNEWGESCPFYESWASKNTFLVGDILVFNFNPGLNSVATVSKSEYDACGNFISTFNPKQLSLTSPTRLQLTSAGDLYIVSLYSGLCYQKVHITVRTSTPTATPTTTRTTTSPSSSSSSSSQSSSSSNNAAAVVKGLGSLIVAYGILHGTVSLTVYCVVHGRKQRQLLAELQAQTNLQDETSPALYADGQNDVDVNDQGEYVAQDQPLR